jgi:hypothetical protein
LKTIKLKASSMYPDESMRLLERFANKDILGDQASMDRVFGQWIGSWHRFSTVGVDSLVGP